MARSHSQAGRRDRSRQRELANHERCNCRGFRTAGAACAIVHWILHLYGGSVRLGGHERGWFEVFRPHRTRQRRTPPEERSGPGALTSTGLLHALWELPLGIPWPSDMLQPRDLESLGEARVGWVKLEADRVERYYRPPGRVIVVAAADRSLSRAIRRVIAHPPTSQRIGLWTSGTTRPHPNAAGSLDLAREHGIGVIAANEGSEHVIVAPKAAVVGRPSIYRWWQAELAYRNWLMQTSPTAPAAPSA